MTRRADHALTGETVMAYKRREHDRACRCDQADAGCAALAVQRLSRTRVQELAEEIWTVSTGTIAPVQPIRDPRSSRPGASAQATYQRRRHHERERWRDGRRWRSGVVAAAVLGVGLLVGHSMGVWLGWRMALLAGVAVWWRLRFHPSANARFWRRQAVMQRRTAGVLAQLEQEGWLVLHDVALPGWSASLDHLVIGPTGALAIESWRTSWLPRRRETTGRSVVGGPRPDLSWKAVAIADSLAGARASPSGGCCACTLASGHQAAGRCRASPWWSCGASPTSSATGRACRPSRPSGPAPVPWRCSGQRPEHRGGWPHPDAEEIRMDRYPPIAEHGLIGDLQTAALVTTDGSIDWFCCPRFDSPSVFGSLLDAERGGRFRIAPQSPNHVAKQLYFPDTAILVTRFLTADGVGEVLDFLPVEDSHRATDRHRLVRVVRCVRGQIRLELECAPRFDYGRQAHELELTDEGAVFHTPTLQLTLHGGGAGALRRHGDDVRGVLTLGAGQTGGVMLESAADGPPQTMTPEELLGLFTETARFWRGWLARSSYRGRWREMVGRSAITLKLMTYAPTGGLVAAPTAGLPEQVGGERNWDYRFTWIRDGSFSVHALLGLG